jgi:hypothetical protein
MTKNKKIALGTGIVIAGIITYVLVNRARKKKEVDLILKYLGEIPNLKDAQANIDALKEMSSDVNSVPNDKKAKVLADLKKIGATGLAGIAKDMRNAIVGPSTNTTLFFNALNKIPSLFIFKQVESIYNKTYTSNLLNDIDGEAALGGMYPSNVLTDPSGALKGLQNSVKQIIFAKPMY